MVPSLVAWPLSYYKARDDIEHSFSCEVALVLTSLHLDVKSKVVCT